MRVSFFKFKKCLNIPDPERLTGSVQIVKGSELRLHGLNAKSCMDCLEWIEFDHFDLIENINKRGAFSSIYSAVWMEGPRWNLDEEAEIWTRSGPIKVILKRINNSQNMSQEFVNQASI
ncbi:unnamed protein product [Rhizophagus irregularis]|nr:unnamed protein product [Rhizophagus irregularis]